MDILKKSNELENFDYSSYRSKFEVAVENKKKEKIMELRDNIFEYYKDEVNIKKSIDFLLSKPDDLALFMFLISTIKKGNNTQYFDTTLLEYGYDEIPVGEYDGGAHFLIVKSQQSKDFYHGQRTLELPEFADVKTEIEYIFNDMSNEFAMDDLLNTCFPIGESDSINIIFNKFEYYDDYKGVDGYYIDKILFPLYLKVEEMLNERKEEVKQALKAHAKELGLNK